MASVAYHRARHASLAALLMLIAAAVVLGSVGTALAAPSEPILSESQLQTLLAGSGGTLDGFFETVVSGATIQAIPCKVLGIAEGEGPLGNDLIFIQASGSVIDQAGGIADGMSGSPLYVMDGGAQTLIGAVSYGRAFTTGGYGLATPIDQMTTLEGEVTGTVDSAQLRTVRGGAAAGKRLLVEPNQVAATHAKPAFGTLVMRPLGLFEIGGLPEQSSVYKQLAADLAKRGIVVTHGATASGGGAGGSFSTPLVAGASVGALYARGPMWYGGVGTVTYVTPTNVLVAFGHYLGALGDSGGPNGAVSAYMINANVLGIWGDSYDPFKMVVPGAVRGVISRDGIAGIAGTIGAPPTDIPFVSNATYGPTGQTKTSTDEATSSLVNSPANTDVTASLIYPAMYFATDNAGFAGNIAYHLVIHVTDGTHEYVIDRHNSYDSVNDAATLAVADTSLLLQQLLANPDGVAPASIESVTVDSTLSPVHNTARILDVSVPGGLHVGANKVHVSLHPYGASAAVDRVATLEIPAGTDLSSGRLFASAPNSGVIDEPGGYSYTTGGGPSGPPQSLGVAAAALNALPAQTDLQLVYDSQSDAGSSYGNSPWGNAAVISSTDTGTVLQGEIDKGLSQMRLAVDRHVVKQGGSVILLGTLSGNSGDTTVAIYRKVFGSKLRALIANVPVTYVVTPDGDSESMFVAPLSDLARGATYTAVWAGDAGAIGASASTWVTVEARVALSAVARPHHTVRLSVRVAPAQKGLVSFQRRHGASWVTLKTRALSASGTATYDWKSRAGSYTFRAIFLGSATNPATASSIRQITLR